jgi:hypothetical protein
VRAWKKPLRGAPGIEPFLVVLIARTGNNKIKVQGVNRGAMIFASHRFLLFSEQDRSRPLTAAEFKSLPWQGAGPDPERASFEEPLDHAARP